MSTLKSHIKSLGPDEIRGSLISWAKKYLSHDESDTFISELCFVDRARRADLVLANGSLSAFEIKSEKDDLSRWAGQQVDYLSCFENVWLCVHAKHIESALQNTHKSIGLLLVDNLSSISMVREAGLNFSLEAYNLTGFLWRADLDKLAKKHGVETKSRMRIKEVREILSTELPLDIIKSFALKTLKARYSSSSSV